jgi:hypothetical protein
MLLYFSGQLLARTSRAWSACRSRLALAVYGGLDFIISKWASYFSYRSLICNPLMSLRSHCSKVASLHHQPKVHFMASSGVKKIVKIDVCISTCDFTQKQETTIRCHSGRKASFRYCKSPLKNHSLKVHPPFLLKTCFHPWA